MCHTNEAASAAQCKFLSMTHHFGCPKVLFTVSYDDGLDLRMLALSGKEDVVQWLECAKAAGETGMQEAMDAMSATRLKFPGLSAYNFECLLDEVLEHIVGDNIDRVGLFGKLEAFAVAIEEQGRKTLHAHILVFIEGWNQILLDLRSEFPTVRAKAEAKVKAFVRDALSTQLTPEAPPMTACPDCGSTEQFSFCDDQTLRTLRHRTGCNLEGVALASCTKCDKKFRGNEIATRRVLPRDKWELSEQNQRNCVAIDSLIETSTGGFTAFDGGNATFANFLFNHHLDSHTRTCFKNGDECRSFLPDRPELETHVFIGDQPHTRFHWTGKSHTEFNITVRPQRLAEDAYTNSHCPVISHSLAPCNSNVSITTGARSAIYASCYSSKGTQKEDTGEAKNMLTHCAVRFQEKRKDSALFEGLSRLMGAVMVGASEHTVAGPMASFLIRNGSRFKFSHTFQYVPIKEIMHISANGTEKVEMTLMEHREGCFFSNQALHYLHRPKSLQHCNVIDFFEQYETTRAKSPEDSGE